MSRPEEQLASLLKECPGLSRQVERFLTVRGGDCPQWPDDVLLPIPAWTDIAHSYVGGPVADAIPLMVKASTIGTWRYSKGVYRFSKALYDALVATELPKELPMRILRRLPDWCPYIELPEPTGGTYGYYCLLDYDYCSGAWELRIVADTENGLVLVPIVLTEGISLLDATSSFADQDDMVSALAAKGTGSIALDALAKAMPSIMAYAKTASLETVRPALSLLLYLCSDAPEIDDSRQPNESPGRVYARRVKGKARIFEPPKTRIWDVGTKLSAALGAPTGRTGAKKSPHIRRAHWHGYWTGPRIGERKFKYAWIPPLAVAVDDQANGCT
jgi:hypothetical protein